MPAVATPLIRAARAEAGRHGGPDHAGDVCVRPGAPRVCSANDAVLRAEDQVRQKRRPAVRLSRRDRGGAPRRPPRHVRRPRGEGGDPYPRRIRGRAIGGSNRLRPDPAQSESVCRLQRHHGSSPGHSQDDRAGDISQPRSGIAVHVVYHRAVPQGLVRSGAHRCGGQSSGGEPAPSRTYNAHRPRRQSDRAPGRREPVPGVRD